MICRTGMGALRCWSTSWIGVVFLFAPVALAQGTPSSTSRVFWTGETSGSPSDAKTSILTSLYVLSGASAVATGYLAYRWLDAQHDLNARDSRGACYDLADAGCRALLEAQAHVRDLAQLTAAGAAATGAFLVTGLLVARHWENSVVHVGVTPRAISLSVEGAF